MNSLSQSDAGQTLPKLGILAGSGPLPRKLVELCHQTGRPVFVMAFDGHTDQETVEGVDHAWSRLGAAGTVIKTLKANAVQEMVMIGPIKRPSVKELRPDWRAMQVLARAGMKSLGDDTLLRGVIDTLEEEGFLFRGVDDFLQDLLMPSGPLGEFGIDDPETVSDVRRGVEVARALGAVDVGQSVVVQDGLVLAVEGIEGTDALILRSRELKREGRGAVLVKLKKPEQDRRADLPTVGLTTLANAVASGFRGIALEAGGSLLVDREQVVRKANEAGVFVCGIHPSDFMEEQETEQ